MKTCEKCSVTVAGDFEKCPLCQTALSASGSAAGEKQRDGRDIFPFIPIVIHEYSFLFRMIQLFSAIIVISAFIINWMIPQSGFWALFVALGVACVWLSLGFAIRKRHNILKNMAYQVTIITVLSILWDVFTGWHGWSVDFVVPIAFIVTMSATPIVAHILKMPAETYIIYLFLLIVYGIIPAVFVWSGLNKFIYLSLVCVAVSLASLAALIIFEGRNMIEELKRRLHL